jgi:hypothetical protein
MVRFKMNVYQPKVDNRPLFFQAKAISML